MRIILLLKLINTHQLSLRAILICRELKYGPWNYSIKSSAKFRWPGRMGLKFHDMEFVTKLVLLQCLYTFGHKLLCITSSLIKNCFSKMSSCYKRGVENWVGSFLSLNVQILPPPSKRHQNGSKSAKKWR